MDSDGLACAISNENKDSIRNWGRGLSCDIWGKNLSEIGFKDNRLIWFTEEISRQNGIWVGAETAAAIGKENSGTVKRSTSVHWARGTCPEGKPDISGSISRKQKEPSSIIYLHCS